MLGPAQLRLTGAARKAYHEYVDQHPEVVAYEAEEHDLTPEQVRFQAPRFFRVELLEPEHRDVLQWVQDHDQVMGVAIMRLWIEENQAELMRATWKRPPKRAVRNRKSIIKHKNSRHFPGPLGTGQRFRECVQSVTESAARRGYPLRSAAAVCASMSRRKYGAHAFADLSHHIPGAAVEARNYARQHGYRA